MSLFHALFHAHHHGHHGFDRHGHDGHHHNKHHRRDHADGDERSIDHLAFKIAKRLDLNDEQLKRLKALIECLQQQREALRGGDWLQDASPLFGGRTFDRDAAQALITARITAVQSAVPTVMDAVAGFYDSLDAEQQQVLRFIIRLGRQYRAHFHDGTHPGSEGVQ